MLHWQFNSFTNSAAHPEGSNRKGRRSQHWDPAWKGCGLPDSTVNEEHSEGKWEMWHSKRLMWRLNTTAGWPAETSHWDIWWRLVKATWLERDFIFSLTVRRAAQPSSSSAVSPSFLDTQSLTLHKTTPAQEHGGPRPPRWNLTLPATWSHRGDKYREEKEWRMGFRKWSKGHAPRQQLPAWDQATQTTTLQVKTRRPVKTTRTRFSKQNPGAKWGFGLLESLS